MKERDGLDNSREQSEVTYSDYDLNHVKVISTRCSCVCDMATVYLLEKEINDLERVLSTPKFE